MTLESINQLIRNRRTVFTEFYSQEEISDEVVNSILENATWAPTHKKTQPWRFIVYRSLESRQALSNMLRDNYRANTPQEEQNEIKEKKISGRPLQAPLAIAIILCRNEDSGLPEWEEVAALACAVQNMYLTCTGTGLGAFWSTPGLATKERAFYNLAENEKCLGLFYAGKLKKESPEFGSSRKDWKEVAQIL